MLLVSTFLSVIFKKVEQVRQMYISIINCVAPFQVVFLKKHGTTSIASLPVALFIYTKEWKIITLVSPVLK